MERIHEFYSDPYFLQKGEPVTIIQGPFKDLDAVFCKADGEERAIVLLNLLHRQQELRVPLKALKASG